MILISAFLLSGFICMIGQIILDNTNLTAGHITSLFTVIGAMLSFLGIYPYLIKYAGAGATVLILNFGNMLFTAGYEGFCQNGLIGIFSNLLSNSSLALTSTIIFSFVFTLLSKPRD